MLVSSGKALVTPGCLELDSATPQRPSCYIRNLLVCSLNTMLAQLLHGKINDHILIPFVRYQYYDGGKKHEKDARSYNVRELGIGVEWQPMKNLEFVALYTISKRRYKDSGLPNNFQDGSLLRLKTQFNY